MKRIIIVSAIILLSLYSRAQNFQLGYAAGLASNYPDNSQNLNNSGQKTTNKLFIQNGIFARYELKRWAIHLAASYYNVSYPYFQIDDYPASYTHYAADQYTSAIIRSDNYLLDLSLQICLNSNKALRKSNFRGIKSYIGFSYSGIITHLNGQAIFHDAIAKTTTYSDYTNNLQHRALGGNYYASCQLSKHLTASLLASWQVATEAVSDPSYNGNTWYWVDVWQHQINGNNPQNYFSLTFGLAYRFSK